MYMFEIKLFQTFTAILKKNVKIISIFYFGISHININNLCRNLLVRFDISFSSSVYTQLKALCLSTYETMGIFLSFTTIEN